MGACWSACMDWKAITAAMRQSDASASKSTAMQPLLYLDSILGLLFIGCLHAVEVPWAWMPLGAAMLGTVVFTMVSYRYFARNSPDELRSEKFNLRKIELGMKEDSIEGRPAGKLEPIQVPELEASGK